MFMACVWHGHNVITSENINKRETCADNWETNIWSQGSGERQKAKQYPANKNVN